MAKEFLKIIRTVKQKSVGPDLGGLKKEMWSEKTNEREEMAVGSNEQQYETPDLFNHIYKVFRPVS
jgi:hypothetical protein